MELPDAADDKEIEDSGKYLAAQQKLHLENLHEQYKEDLDKEDSDDVLIQHAGNVNELQLSNTQINIHEEADSTITKEVQSSSKNDHDKKFVPQINKNNISMITQGVENESQLVAQDIFHEPLQIARTMEIQNTEHVLGSYTKVSNRAIVLFTKGQGQGSSQELTILCMKTIPIKTLHDLVSHQQSTEQK